jgi:Putative adhesin
MKNLFLATAYLVTLAAIASAPAQAEEAAFTRDLAVSGRVDLTVATGSGSIHLTSGPAGRVHIFGRVKSNWGGSDAKVHEIADHPPIEQTGNIVRIGARHEDLRNINIDYEIQVPPDAFLNAATGSGSITDDGVGANAKLNTGSGSIHATGLQGGFTVSTGSGSIYAEQLGTGDVKAETGSGSIELKNLHGGLHAETGSGSIKAGGTPSASWRLHTGSGSVEIWTGGASFTLDAESGSSNIHCDREIASQETTEHHHMAGKVGGGGPAVRIETGSGGIHIH